MLNILSQNFSVFFHALSNLVIINFVKILHKCVEYETNGKFESVGKKVLLNMLSSIRI